jgi:ABC-type uncharacterized transport system ATPase subunit
MPPALELRRIVKRFPGVLANDHIDLSVDAGEIRALVGENGAGKTTLMNILYGLSQPDEGEILIHGEQRHFHSPLEAIRSGLGMVHQHFMLFPSLTVTENVIYGAEPAPGGLIDRRAAEQTVAALSERFGLQIDPRERVAALPVGVRQRIEIVKMLFRGAEILILDEPTAVLTPQETTGLFSILRALAEDGKTVVFISHKLREVLELSHTATVLRDGRVTGSVETSATSAEELCRLMVGREVFLQLDKAPPAEVSEPVLQLTGLKVASASAGGTAGSRKAAVDGVDLEVGMGEILGIAGAAGNGQTELIDAICGLRGITEGRIRLRGRDLSTLDVGARRVAGMSHVPEDRDGAGLALAASLSDNLLMGFEASRPFAYRGILSSTSIAEWSEALLEDHSIQTTTVSKSAGTLSGGNRQKLVLARELAHQAQLLIVNQPTRGVDIGSTEQIYELLVEYRDRGNAVLLVSTDLTEILTLADRIVVLFEGRVAGEVAGAAATEEALGMLMTGGIPS